MTTTPGKLEYPSDKGHIDDGKNYLDVILWNMNVGHVRALARFLCQDLKQAIFQPLLSLPVRHP